MEPKSLKIGLALGAGGAKGLAHIGIIKILEKYHIPIDYISGASIGSVVGGFYAAKKNIAKVEEIAVTNNWPQIFSIFFNPSIFQVFSKGDKIKNFVEKYIGNIEFNRLIIPFAAIATRFSDGKTITIKEGRVSDGIRASVSLPLLFKPAVINNELYVDGGMSVPVPVKVLKEMGADFTIAVNLAEDFKDENIDPNIGINKILNRTISILTHYLSIENVKEADFVLNPKVGDVGLFDKFLTKEGSSEVIRIGENCMEENIEKLKAVLKNKQKNIEHKDIGFVNRIKQFVKTYIH